MENLEALRGRFVLFWDSLAVRMREIRTHNLPVSHQST